MEAGRGAFSLLGLSSPALMLVAGTAEDFLLGLFEMSDPIALTPQATKGRQITPDVTSVSLAGAAKKQLILTRYPQHLAI